MEETQITIEDILAKYKDSNPDFYYSYLDCYPINEIEDCIIENATYSGYSIKDEYGNRFFTEVGIRGISKGTFYIYKGVPYAVEKIPTTKQMFLLEKIPDNSRVYSILRDNWYEYQKEQVKESVSRGRI